MGGHDRPPGFGLWRRTLGIEFGQIKLAQIGGHMLGTAVVEPRPHAIEVFALEIALAQLRPGHEVAPILFRQIDAVGPVVGRDDDADAIEHVMFAQMLLVDPQYVGRRRGIYFK